ncbi:hypothetical protein [Lunatimonas salinarum]|uniref:hypothetical protein n=1 Tax=Lunatimonas salinarum TaxID=1774590 RepID=UPI001AE06F2E|nr:hypothetical protein [Lunatimonas salinarum]
MTRIRRMNEWVLSVCMVLCLAFTLSVFIESISIPAPLWALLLLVGSASFVTRAMLMKKHE